PRSRLSSPAVRFILPKPRPSAAQSLESSRILQGVARSAAESRFGTMLHGVRVQTDRGVLAQQLPRARLRGRRSLARRSIARSLSAQTSRRSAPLLFAERLQLGDRLESFVLPAARLTSMSRS